MRKASDARGIVDIININIFRAAVNANTLIVFVIFASHTAHSAYRLLVYVEAGSVANRAHTVLVGMVLVNIVAVDTDSNYILMIVTGFSALGTSAPLIDGVPAHKGANRADPVRIGVLTFSSAGGANAICIGVLTLSTASGANAVRI